MIFSATELRDMTELPESFVEDYINLIRAVEQLAAQSSVSKLNELYNINGGLCVFSGNGASDPTVTTNRNIQSVTRQSAGVYRIVLSQPTMYGVGLLTDSAVLVSINVAAGANTDFYTHVADVVDSSTVDIKILEVTQGAGTRLAATPYDLVDSSDVVSVSLQVSGSDTLPPA